MPPVYKLTADEEKKLRIMNFVVQSNSVFSSSTLEQIAKAAKVSNMQIKGLIQQLADENLLNQDKIGAGTFYWKFKSEESQQLVLRRDSLKQYEQEIKKDIADLDVYIAQLREKFKDQPDTVPLYEQLSQLTKQLKECQRKESLMAKNSPVYLQRLRELAEEARTGANTETDNIFSVVHYLKKQLNVYNEQIEQIMDGWSPELDYVE